MIVFGAVVGAIFGAATNMLPGLIRGPLFWVPIFSLLGGFLGWLRAWILRQSSDVPKMRAALPLSGPVLVSLTCVAIGEPFLGPVLSSIVLGVLLTRLPPLRAAGS